VKDICRISLDESNSREVPIKAEYVFYRAAAAARIKDNCTLRGAVHL